MSMSKNGYRLDAEAWGKAILEIIQRRKPKIWAHLGTSEGDYLKWAATWAFHWANKHLSQQT